MNDKPSLTIDEPTVTGWLRMELSGDHDKAIGYTHTGRTVLGGLRSRMGVNERMAAGEGGGFYHQSVMLEDGTVIQVMTNDGHDTVRISVPVHVPEPEPVPVPVDDVEYESCFVPDLDNSYRHFSDIFDIPIESPAMASNDDQSGDVTDFGFEVSFFGDVYTTFAISNNGYIGLGGAPSEAYTPRISPILSGEVRGPETTQTPIIAPYFSDIDTRPPSVGQVLLSQGEESFDSNGKTRKYVLVYWNNCGYYNIHADKTVDFQLILIEKTDSCPALIGFSYKNMEWETGDVSEFQDEETASDGFGNIQAFVGFATASAFALGYVSGSNQAGISNVVQGKQIWFEVDDDGVPLLLNNLSYNNMGKY